MQDLVSSIDGAIKERREEIRLLQAAKDALRAPAPARPRRASPTREMRALPQRRAHFSSSLRGAGRSG